MPLLLQLLAACSYLPAVPTASPAMTLAAYGVLYLQYRALMWFQWWHIWAYPRLSASALADELSAELDGPVGRLLHWLFTSPRGRALYEMLWNYGGGFILCRRLICSLLAGLAAIPALLQGL